MSEWHSFLYSATHCTILVCDEARRVTAEHNACEQIFRIRHSSGDPARRHHLFDKYAQLWSGLTQCSERWSATATDPRNHFAVSTAQATADILMSVVRVIFGSDDLIRLPRDRRNGDDFANCGNFGWRKLTPRYYQLYFLPKAKEFLIMNQRKWRLLCSRFDTDKTRQYALSEERKQGDPKGLKINSVSLLTCCLSSPARAHHQHYICRWLLHIHKVLVFLNVRLPFSVGINVIVTRLTPTRKILKASLKNWRVINIHRSPALISNSDRANELKKRWLEEMKPNKLRVETWIILIFAEMIITAFT